MELSTPKNLKEFAHQYSVNLSGIEDAELVKFFIAAEKFKFEWNESNRHCDICDVKLTNENFAGLDGGKAFNYCCKNHAEYSNVFQTSIIRYRLGFQDNPYPMPRNIPSFYD